MLKVVIVILIVAIFILAIELQKKNRQLHQPECINYDVARKSEEDDPECKNPLLSRKSGHCPLSTDNRARFYGDLLVADKKDWFNLSYVSHYSKNVNELLDGRFYGLIQEVYEQKKEESCQS